MHTTSRTYASNTSELFHSPQEICRKTEERIQQLQDAIQAEQEKMRALTEAGLIRAGTWYKNGTYLYLIHPSDGFGYRKREYVGADPAKVKAALDSIERAKQYDDAKARASLLQQKLHSTTYHLRQAFDAARFDSIPGYW